jgi:hypothetical protein
MSEPLGPRLYLAHQPSEPELEHARERLTPESCPRRYCWYWQSLRFDWELEPGQGCEVAERHITKLILERSQRHPLPQWQECCRASDNPLHPDFYEPREPHLKDDGWPVNFFLVVGKAARRRRYARRMRGKQQSDESGGPSERGE